MTAPAEQVVEWVDDHGRVLSLVSRSQVRARNLLHRSVAVVVRSPAGEVLVHRRADWKDVWPGYWDLAVGGVVGVGEPWAAAARRELAEEVGVEATELVELGAFTYRDSQVAALARVFTTTAAGPFAFADGEVVEAGWVPLDELEAWVGAHAVCPDSLAGVLPLL
ncbi:MAG: NUDIX domain-containing protein [Acidimicrobiia bacterium]|nr:NUDIX domain-containing protein [Acidimicrobiia bacterium]